MIVDPSVVYTREQVVANLRKAVSASPVSFDFLLKQAEIESGLNPNAKAATSSASGPFQFVNGTWLRMVEKYGDNVGLSDQAAALRENRLDGAAKAELLALRTDVAISGKMAAHFALDNAKSLMSSGVSQIGPTELYLAHFLGAGGAKEFLSAMQANPNAPAADAVPSAAKANANVFFNNGVPRSLAEIYNRFAEKFSGIPSAIGNVREALAQTELMPGARPSQLNAQSHPDQVINDVSGLPPSEIGQHSRLTARAEFQAIAEQVLSEAGQQSRSTQKLQADRAQQDTINTEELSASLADVSAAALTQYLQGFARGVDDAGQATLGTAEVDSRDASRGASVEGGVHDAMGTIFGQQNVAIGMKMVMETAGKRSRETDHALAEAKTAAPAMSPAVKQAVQWVSLFSDPKGADASQVR